MSNRSIAKWRLIIRLAMAATSLVTGVVLQLLESLHLLQTG